MTQQGDVQVPARHVRTGYERVTLETSTPWTSGPTEALAGWALVLGGPLTALVWLATRAPAVDADALDPSSWIATLGPTLTTVVLAVLLALLAVGSVLTGLGLLRQGRRGIDLRVAGATFLPVALGAVVADRTALAVVALAALGALVLASRGVRRR
jgi:threonine/homoserine/homoserine lactone efflux protein